MFRCWTIFSTVKVKPFKVTVYLPYKCTVQYYKIQLLNCILRLQLVLCANLVVLHARFAGNSTV